MLLRTLIATALGCLTLPAQESTLSTNLPTAVESNSDPAEIKLEKSIKGGEQLTLVPGAKYLKVYTFETADTREVTKTLSSLKLPSVQIVNDDAKSRQIQILATARQHSEIASLIRQLDSAVHKQETADDTQPKRNFKVSVALIRNDWREQLSNHEQFSAELKELYKDVDLSALGGELQEAAPTLLFPDKHAAIFNVRDISKLTGRLTQLGLQKSVPVTEGETDELSQYSFENYDVPELLIPLTPTRSIKDYGPFAKLTGTWSLGIGADTGNEDSVICVRHYTQFVETEWPTRTKHVERRQIDSNHFGSRFDLNMGEVAVLRFSAADPRSSRGFAPGMSSAMMGMSGLGASPGSDGMLGLSGLGGSGSQSDLNDSSFAVIMVGYADDLKPDLDVDPGWSKPLKTTALETFDYDSARQNSRRPTASGRSGFSGLRATAQQPTSNESTAKPTEVSFTVYSLRNVRAEDASKLVQQLFPAETEFRVAADDRTNSLLVSASEEDHNELRNVLKVLDADVPQDKTPKAADDRKADRMSVEMEMGPAGVMILKGSKENVAAAEQMLKQMTSTQLLDRSKQLEDKAIARAAEYLKDGSVKKDLESLKQTVQEDFDVRQRLQLAEIEFLKARLEDLERRVRQKEQLKDRIIDRRIESLLTRPANVEKKASAKAPNDAVKKSDKASSN